MSEGSLQSVWVVLRFELDGDAESEGILSHVEVHTTDASADAAASTLMQKGAPKNKKQMANIDIVENPKGTLDSIQSWTWTLRGKGDDFKVQIVKKALKHEDSTAPAEAEGKFKAKRKAKEAPEESKAVKTSKSKAKDREVDEAEKPSDKPAVRKKPGVIADGKKDCLQDVKLLFTGTFDSMDRKGCVETAEMYGATIVKKLEDADYVVMGVKAGPKKVEEIEKLNLSTMNEEEFLDVLKTGELP